MLPYIVLSYLQATHANLFTKLFTCSPKAEQTPHLSLKTPAKHIFKRAFSKSLIHILDYEGNTGT